VKPYYPGTDPPRYLKFIRRLDDSLASKCIATVNRNTRHSRHLRVHNCGQRGRDLEVKLSSASRLSARFLTQFASDQAVQFQVHGAATD
jgi:hypothetical protein